MNKDCHFGSDGYCEFFVPGENGCLHCGSKEIPYLSREAYMAVKEADRIAEMTGNRAKYPNPTNEKLAGLGLSRPRGEGK